MDTNAGEPERSTERETLIEIYDDQRHNLLIAMRGLTEEGARTRSNKATGKYILRSRHLKKAKR